MDLKTRLIEKLEENGQRYYPLTLSLIHISQGIVR